MILVSVAMTWIKVIGSSVQCFLLFLFVYEFIQAWKKYRKGEVGLTFSYQSQANVPFPSVALVKDDPLPGIIKEILVIREGKTESGNSFRPNG